MAGVDSNTASISAILDAYMYLNYQYNPEESQEKNINQILEDIESLHEDNEYYKVLKKACEENPSLGEYTLCLLYTSPSPRDVEESRMPSSA